jgi:hypothetical protein
MGIESVELTLEIEKRFGIELPNRIARNEAVHGARTVGELEEMVLRLRREQLSATERERLSEGEVGEELRCALSYVFGDPPASFTPEVRLIDDLAMDQ